MHSRPRRAASGRATLPVMKVDISIQRGIEIPVPYARMQEVLRDLEATIRRFPKLRRLKKLGDNAYLWEMETIGSRIAKIAHDVAYGARYDVSLDEGVVTWKPIPGQGNAAVEGNFRIEDLGGKKTRLSCLVKGELRDVPVPLLYRIAAPAFIQGKFTALVDGFLERTAQAASRAKVAA
jgi:hypothetical protein